MQTCCVQTQLILILVDCLTRSIPGPDDAGLCLTNKTPVSKEMIQALGRTTMFGGHSIYPQPCFNSTRSELTAGYQCTKQLLFQ